MKLRGGHLLFIIVAAVCGLVALVAFYHGRQESWDGAGDEEDFLARIHRLQDATPLTLGDGPLPPIDAEQDLVPVIALETLDLDLGTVSNTANTKHQLKVFNHGKAPLRISDIKTSCAACTLGFMPPERAVIPPGGESYIEVLFMPRGVAGFFSQKTLTIFSNDPKQPALTVNVKAAVDPEFSLEPEEIDFGILQKGETPDKTMYLRQLREARVELLDVREFGPNEKEKESGAFHFAFEALPESDWTAPDKAEYRITVAPSPLLPPGPFHQRFTIITNVERIPVLWAFAKGEVIAPYTVEPTPPKRLMLAPGGLATVPERPGGSAVIKGEHPLQIADIAPESAWVEAVSRPGDTATTAYLDVTLRPDAPEGRHDDAVRFTVLMGEKKYPERIAVRGFVRR